MGFRDLAIHNEIQGTTRGKIVPVNSVTDATAREFVID